MMRALKIKMCRVSLMSASAAALAVATATPAVAQAQVRNFDIPAQPLSSALLEFSRQSDILIVVSPDLTQGKRSPALRGPMPANEAVARLLRGSGLHAVPNPRGGYRIERTTTSSSNRPARAASSSVEATGEDFQAGNDREIVVTGSRLQNAVESTFASRYTGQDIAESGQTSVSGFLGTLPQVSLQAPVNTLTTFGETVSVQLRGLPVGTTLVLVDGQRVSNSALAGTSFDLNALPIGLVDRIDVIGTGASAIYGSDAIAGVVNVVTRRRFTGFSASASYGFADDYHEELYSVSAGVASGGFEAWLGGTYQRHDALFGRDRATTSSKDFSRFAAVGGRDTRGSNYCMPGTISSVSGNLPGLPSNVAAIPANNANPRIADFLPTAGQTNRCSDDLTRRTIIGELEQFSVLGGAAYDFGGTRVEASLLYSWTKKDPSADVGLQQTNLVIPASNAFNPFGVAVRYTGQIPAPRQNINTTQFIRPSINARGSLSEDWQWNVTLTGDINEVDLLDINGSGANASALSAALASSNPATAFNPFAPELTNPEVLRGISVFAPLRYRATGAIANGFVRGKLLELPAGAVELVVGGELARETFRTELSAGTSSGRRTVKAAFGEVLLPLVQSSAVGAADLTVAGRYSDYSDFGGNFSPQARFQWRPSNSLTFEAGYSESFRAPQLNQLNQVTQTVCCITVADPRRNNELVTVPRVIGGNLSLNPERGRALTFGGRWTSEQLGGLRLSLNWFEIRERDRIVNPSSSNLLTGVVNNEDLFPGRVVRGPTVNGVPGPIQRLDLFFANFGRLVVQGFDGQIRMPFQIGDNRFAVQADATLLTRFDAEVAPGAGLVDVLGKATTSDVWAPSFKATLATTWENGPFSARVAGRYTGQYRDYLGLNGLAADIGDFWYVDASLEVNLADVIGGGNRMRPYFRVSAVNLLDRAPKYSNYFNSFLGYDAFQENILGRFVTLSLGVKW